MCDMCHPHRVTLVCRAQDSDAGALPKALRYCQEVLDVRRAQDEAAGTLSAETLMSIQNVGMMLRALGHKERALEMLKEAMAGLEVVAGHDDRRTIRCGQAVGSGCLNPWFAAFFFVSTPVDCVNTP